MWLVLADDLTGACDVAAAMGQDAWVPVASRDLHHRSEVVVYNTATRDVSITEARLAIASSLDLLPEPIAYWKIDSLLRGHWAQDLAEAFRRQAVERVLVAPAFPDQHRTTVRGVQYAHGVPVSSIAEHLVAAGIPCERFRIADASTSQELRKIAESLQPDETPVGSAGLARAIWGPRSVVPERMSGLILVVVGTASERGRAQIEPLKAFRHLRIIEPAAQSDMVRSIQESVAQCMPAAIIVAGGETLASFAQQLSIGGFLVKGELAPGVALAKIVDGPMDSRQIVTKAGDFGERETLAHAAEMLVSAGEAGTPGPGCAA